MTNTPILPLWIGGQEVAGSSGRVGDVFNPAFGQVVRRVPFASSIEIDRAVAAARAAFPGWRNTPPLRRSRILARYREVLEGHRDELAGLITEEKVLVMTGGRARLRGRFRAVSSRWSRSVAA